MENIDINAGPSKSLLDTLKDLREWALQTGGWEAAVWRDFETHLTALERECKLPADLQKKYIAHTLAQLRSDQMRGVRPVTGQDTLKNASRPWGLGRGPQEPDAAAKDILFRASVFRAAAKKAFRETGFAFAVGGVVGLATYLIGRFQGAPEDFLWQFVPLSGMMAAMCVMIGYLRSGKP